MTLWPFKDPVPVLVKPFPPSTLLLRLVAVLALPLMLPLIVLVKVLVPPIVWLPEFLITVPLTATLSAATLIPSPAPTLRVLSAVSSPPPLKPFPAITLLLRLVAVVAVLALPWIVLVKVLIPPIVWFPVVLTKPSELPGFENQSAKTLADTGLW